MEARGKQKDEERAIVGIGREVKHYRKRREIIVGSEKRYYCEKRNKKEGERMKHCMRRSDGGGGD